AGDWVLALAWLERGRELGLATTATANIAMGAFADAGRWLDALALLPRLRVPSRDTISEQDVAVSFNTAVSACERGGEWQWCIALLSQMHEFRVPWALPVRRSVARACGRAGRWQASAVALERLSRSWGAE
ncbi:unnamed protein product, partial [Polarella glacialis]